MLISTLRPEGRKQRSFVGMNGRPFVEKESESEKEPEKVSARESKDHWKEIERGSVREIE